MARPRADKSPDAAADPESVARAIALRMLERQPRTRAELARGMARRGVPEDAAAAVLDRFAEVGLIDDDAFAAAWVDSRHAGRGLGRRALSAELRARGVADETVATAVSAVSDDDEAEAARALAARRLRSLTGLPTDVRLRRLVGMLNRRGFAPSLSLRVARQLLSEVEADV